MLLNKNLDLAIRHFSPAWYASVMGTGGLANVFYELSTRLGWLRVYSQILLFLNIALFVILIIPWIIRWFTHFDKVLEDLRHSIMANFFVTMPVGVVVLGTNLFIIGPKYFSSSFIDHTGIVLWIFGCLSIMYFGIAAAFNLFRADKVSHEVTNFAWLISPVASIVIPLLGDFVAKNYIPSNIPLARTVNLVDIIFYGTGFMLFILFSSVVLQRFVSHPMPESVAAPTFWIMLGPVGGGVVSLMGLASISKAVGLLSSVSSLNILAIIFWGFGLWAFLFVLAISFWYLLKGKIPFSLSWWAFIFPLAIYAISSYSVYLYTKVDAIYWYTIVLVVLLSLLWLVAFINSIIGIYTKKLLIPKKSNS